MQALFAQHSVHPNPGKIRRGWRGGNRLVFRQFARLEADSVKAAFSRPAHQRVTQAVSLLLSIFQSFLYNEYVELSKRSSMKKLTGLEFNTKL
jgi:hypothetical protein